jgi:hypothetical protein
MTPATDCQAREAPLGAFTSTQSLQAGLPADEQEPGAVRAEPPLVPDVVTFEHVTRPSRSEDALEAGRRLV